MSGVGDVVLHLATPFAPASAFEVVTSAARAPIVHLQHGVTAGGQHLDIRVEVPVVAYAVRPAVHEHHHGQVFGAFLAWRIADVALQFEPVACGELKGLLPGHHFRIDPRCARQQRRKLLGVAVVEIERAGVRIGFGKHNAQTAIGAPGNKADIFAGKLVHQRDQHFRIRRLAIEKRHARSSISKAHPYDVVACHAMDEAVGRNFRVAPYRGPGVLCRVPAAYAETTIARSAHEVRHAVIETKSTGIRSVVAWFGHQLPAVAVERMHIDFHIATDVFPDGEANMPLMIGDKSGVAHGWRGNDVHRAAIAHVHAKGRRQRTFLEGAP